MEKMKQKKTSSKNFKWTPSMERVMLETLAEEANLGNKPSNSFRSASFFKVANVIFEKFDVECEHDNAENRLQTIKKTWGIISTLKARSGVGWNENLKMITSGREEYDEEVLTNSISGKHLNKKIEMYDEMTLVVGKDLATCSFSNYYIDHDMGEKVVDSMEVEGLSSAQSSKEKARRKRNQSSITSTNDNQIGELYENIGEMEKALKTMRELQSKYYLDLDKLLEEVMKCEGFDRIQLGKALDFLVENEKQAKTFMVKPYDLRNAWMDNFLGNN